jgi:RimJ/RimL family protein N-acetyltransferase
MTTGVRIRLYEPADADDILAAALESVADMNRWMPWCHPGYSLQESKDWLDDQKMKRKSKDSFEFAILGRGDAYLGGCGLNRIDKEYQTANLGYWVRSSATGQGVAPEAARQLIEWAFANTELNRLEILCAEDNTRSQRVAEKIGATREGLLRCRLILNKEIHNAIVYAVVRDDQLSI